LVKVKTQEILLSIIITGNLYLNNFNDVFTMSEIRRSFYYGTFYVCRADNFFKKHPSKKIDKYAFFSMNTNNVIT